MNEKIWLSSPHLEGNELEFIQDAFQKNWVTTLGENINFFEHQLEKYLGENKNVVALNSCTSAIHLALVLLGIESGDEVLTQSLTFAGSAFPICYQQATPVFIDSEEGTWNMSPEFLEIAIKDRIKGGKKPKAIIPVHLYGMPYQADEINEIAKYYQIPVVEDAAEALGSVYKNRKCGTLGELATISFNGNKIITTAGGGALICSNGLDKEKAVFLSSQARDKASHYEHSQVGYNYGMSNILAGLGRSQLDALDKRVKARRLSQNFYNEVFRDIDGVQVHTEPSTDYFSNHWLSAITVDPKVVRKTREDLRLAFLEDNIESRPIWKPMHLQPVFKDAPFYGGQIAKELFERGLCLPSGSNLSDNQKDRIATIIKNIFK